MSFFHLCQCSQFSSPIYFTLKIRSYDSLEGISNPSLTIEHFGICTHADCLKFWKFSVCLEYDIWNCKDSLIDMELVDNYQFRVHFYLILIQFTCNVFRKSTSSNNTYCPYSSKMASVTYSLIDFKSYVSPS